LSLIEERERRRIATELHDHIGHTLALCKIKLGVLRELTSSPLATSLDEVRSLIEQTIQYARSLTFELSPPILYELGYEAAVEWLGEKILRQHGILFNFNNDEHSKPLNEEARILLFQAVRELLVNIVKHAKANHVTISIKRDGDNMRVSVEDDGIGFEVSKTESYLSKSSGFGLFSIHERLKYINGYINIESVPGHGTRATIVVPLKLGRLY
jgi:signal transduction histidine kinase